MGTCCGAPNLYCHKSDPSWAQGRCYYQRGGWVAPSRTTVPPTARPEPSEESNDGGEQAFGQPEAEQPEPVNDGLTEENWGSQGNNDAPVGGSSGSNGPSHLNGGPSGDTETESWGEPESSSSQGEASGNPDQGFD